MREPGHRSIPGLVLGFLVCLIYSIIFAGQVLGLLGIYRNWIAIPLAVLVFVLSGYFCFKSLPVSDDRTDGASAFSKVDLLFGVCALALTALLVALPLILWPASPAGKTLTWDAGLFQFPKAIELFRSGSMWDMNVCYAEYPLGYEALLSFALLIGGNTVFFGFVHFLLALFLIAAIWMLAKRYTNLPSGLLLLGIVAILLSGFLNKDNNPWWIYYPLLFTVGKNDLFQGAAVLAVLAYAPLAASRDEDKDQSPWNPLGFALTSMIAFSIKPNSLIILPLWLLAFYQLWKVSPSTNEQNIYVTARSGLKRRGGLLTHEIASSLGSAPRNDRKEALLMVAIALPGLSWVFRNLAALHTFFTPAVLKLGGLSIASNLSNPNLYRYIPVYLYFFLALTGLVTILAILRKRISLAAAITLLVLLFGFALTPASAFHGNTQGRAEIAWRFAITFISYALLLLLVIISPLLKKLIEYAGRYRVVLIVLAIGALTFSGFFFWRMRQLLRYVPENAIILRDQFEQPVGTGGYFSAYDYAQKNIRNATIIVDNGLPFYAYDASFTNATACSGHAGYFIVFNTDWASGDPADYPEYVGTASWANDWDVVYEDSYSRVYHRR